MQMSVSQILQVNGWRTTWSKFYKCPVCKQRIFGDAWMSPKATRYHPQCVEKSPQVKRLLTKRALDVCPRCDGKKIVLDGLVTGKCLSCNGTGKRQ